MRLLNIMVMGALILAASFVYKIKFDSTLQSERLSRLRGELRQEQDAIASLRGQWARFDNPARVQTLAQRYLPLRRIEPHQFEDFSRLPERPQPVAAPAPADPIGAMAVPGDEPATGSIGAPR